MSFAGFRADRLNGVALLQALAFGLGHLLFGWTGWALPAALLVGASLLVLLRLEHLPRMGQVLSAAMAGLAFLCLGWILLQSGLPVTAAMIGLLALGLAAAPLLTAERSSPTYANAHEISGPVFGLVMAGTAGALLLSAHELPVLGLLTVPVAVNGLLGGALYLLDPFVRLRKPVLLRTAGLAYTLPLSAAALAMGSYPLAVAWLVWAGALLVGDVRALSEWRLANDQLQKQQERYQALNAALSESEERFRIAFQNAPIGMAVVNTDGRIYQVNPSVCEMLGYTKAELTALGFQEVTHPHDREQNVRLFRGLLSGEIDRYRIEKRYLHKHGRFIWADVQASVVRDHEGAPLYILGQLQDLTERMQFEAQLQELADRDALTGLYNRRRFYEGLEWVVALWKRYGSTGAVVLIDLDGFKSVNDSLGHHIGDELLRRVAAVLITEMRSTDLYGRLGGDEFAFFLSAVGPQEAMAVAERVLKAIERVTNSGEFRSVRVMGSAGVAMLPEHGTDIQDLMIRADMAMYQAKRSGKNQAVMYGPEATAVFNAPLA